MIVYSIVVTAFLMCAVVALVYEHIGRIKAEDAGTECMKALQEAEEKITGYRIEKANRDGVDAGRISDTMYRNFLKQYSAGEQVTVMFRRNDAKYYAGKH
jgi:hypothetical protein